MNAFCRLGVFNELVSCMNRGDLEYSDGPYAWNEDCAISYELTYGLMLWERGYDMSLWNPVETIEIPSEIKLDETCPHWQTSDSDKCHLQSVKANAK